MQRWYVRQNGKAFGPIAPGQLKDLVRSGKIAPDSNVRLGDKGKWVPAAKVRGLFPASVANNTTAGKSRPGRAKSGKQPSDSPAPSKPAEPPSTPVAMRRDAVNPYQPPMRSPSAGVPVKTRAGGPHKLAEAFQTIWLQPRVTIRWLIEERNPHEAILLISIVFGLKYFDNVLSSEDGQIAFGLLAAPIAIPISALIGIIVLYLFGLLYRLVGRMLGGDGDGPSIRTAFAWSLFVPAIAGLPIDILYFASYVVMPPKVYVPLWVFNFPILVLNIWGLTIQIAGLSVAHRFSILRAIVTVLLSFLIIFSVIFSTIMIGANLVMFSYL